MPAIPASQLTAQQVLELRRQRTSLPPPAPGEIPTICAEHDTRFRDLTRQGNEAFAAGHHDRAQHFYEAALAEARTVFRKACEEAGTTVLVAPMLLNIACQNLATVRRLSGDETGAVRLVRHAIERLVDTAATVTCPLEMRINCARHLRHALGLLDDPSVHATPEDRTNADLVRRAAEVTAEVMRTAQLYFATPGDAGEKLS